MLAFIPVRLRMSLTSCLQRPVPCLEMRSYVPQLAARKAKLHDNSQLLRQMNDYDTLGSVGFRVNKGDNCFFPVSNQTWTTARVVGVTETVG